MFLLFSCLYQSIVVMTDVSEMVPIIGRHAVQPFHAHGKDITVIVLGPYYSGTHKITSSLKDNFEVQVEPKRRRVAPGCEASYRVEPGASENES